MVHSHVRAMFTLVCVSVCGYIYGLHVNIILCLMDVKYAIIKTTLDWDSSTDDEKHISQFF